MSDLTFYDSGLDYGNITYEPEIPGWKANLSGKWMSIINGPSDILSTGPRTLFRVKLHCHFICIFKNIWPVCMYENYYYKMMSDCDYALFGTINNKQ